jgi:uncharacterized membrane protein YdbT with pleckstrin-like domain
VLKISKAYQMLGIHLYIIVQYLQNKMSRELDSSLEKRLQPDETVEHVTNMDMRTYLAGSMNSVISSLVTGIVLAVFALVFGLAALGPLLAVPIAILLVIGVGSYPLIRALIIVKYGSITYAITDNRFVKVRDTVFDANEESVPIERARDAEYDEDFFDKMLGNGDIYVEGARGDSVRFENAPDADDLYQKAQKKIQETDQVDDYSA